MDFDQLVIEAFGTADLSTLAPDRIIAGVRTLRDRFDEEGDADDRLAIWCLLCMLHAAPDPGEAFHDEADREAAREFAMSLDETGQD